MKCIVLIGFFAVITGFGAELRAATIHVPGDQPTIQAAITAALSGDTILVADGTYSGADNRDLDFQEKTLTVASEHGSSTCIIDCEGSAVENHRGFKLSYSVMPTESSTISGLSIRNGYSMYGGGMNGENVNLNIADCVFYQNTSEYSGGGLYLEPGSMVLISDSFFSGNTAGIGAGLATVGSTLSSSLEMTRCVISDNTSPSGCGGLSNSIECRLVRCAFRNNEGRDVGAFNSSSDDPVSVSYCEFSGNSAMEPDLASGGAIRVEGLNTAIVNSTITGNHSARFGGGIYCGYGNPKIGYCTISNNAADESGGGLYCNNSTPWVTNSVFFSNTAQVGGAIACIGDAYPPPLELRHLRQCRGSVRRRVGD